MNIGTILCLMLGGSFLVLGILFAILKDKGAILISGFNSLSKEKRAKYDQVTMSKDVRNNFFLWFAILFIGAILNHFLCAYSAIIAVVIWLILFIKDVHLDVEKAFDKYKL